MGEQGQKVLSGEAITSLSVSLCPLPNGAAVYQGHLTAHSHLSGLQLAG